MRAGEAWLQANAPAAPAALLAKMIAALPAAATSDAEALAEAAMQLYASVAERCGGREDALPLLAADALLTHAFQAQAELAPDALDDFARRWGGAGRMGSIR